jgi:hypothetical protein
VRGLNPDRRTYTVHSYNWSGEVYGWSVMSENGKQVIVYDRGVWAEKVEKPDIVVNGYKGEFLDWGVKFGCAEIGKEVFIDISRLIDRIYPGNKSITSVKIGKGDFSVEQIIEIAEHFKEN